VAIRGLLHRITALLACLGREEMQEVKRRGGHFIQEMLHTVHAACSHGCKWPKRTPQSYSSPPNS
jgi:hypothetical protein